MKHQTSPDFSGFDYVLPLVYAAAPGLPETAAEHYVREAAIAFCERSSWLERVSILPAAPCTMDRLPILPHDCERVVRVIAVGNANDIENPTYDGWEYEVEALDTPDAAVFVSRGDECTPVGIRYVAAPARDACLIDARLTEEWRSALAWGALGEVLLLPDFAKPELAAFYAAKFEGEILRARARRYTRRKGGARGIQMMDHGNDPSIYL